MTSAGEPPMFQQPVIPGFHPDPSIVKVGKDFYLANSSFEYFPGIPIFHSRDLVHWKQLGYALTRPSQLPLSGAKSGGGLYAPTLRYHKGTFYLVVTNVDGGGNAIFTAKDPAGPWSEPVWLRDYYIDPSLFFDDDGKVYYTRHEDGAKGGIIQAPIDPESGKFLTPLKPIYNDLTQVWNEGPHLYKMKGFYYLMLSEGGTFSNHAVYIARSHSPWGPFDPCPGNPILTERRNRSNPIQDTGHADLVEASEGNWWMVFLGTRPVDGHPSPLGRETFLAPVNWTADGWPVVNSGKDISLRMPVPDLPRDHAAPPPGRDDFHPENLGVDWVFLRNPDPATWSLEEHPGYLRLKGSSATLGDQLSPAFIGRRQESFGGKITTRMDFEPSKEGEEAGLVVRLDEGNHFDLLVGWVQKRLQVFLRQTLNGVGMVLNQSEIKSGTVDLQIKIRPDQYEFLYSTDGKNFTSLGTGSSVNVSPARLNTFTGAVFGLYATGNGTPCGGPADFDWFQYDLQ